MEKKELDRLLRAADIIDIQNIMGRYLAYLDQVNFLGIYSLMAQDHPEITYEMCEDGAYIGPENVRKYMHDEHTHLNANPNHMKGWIGLQNILTPRIVFSEEGTRAKAQFNQLSPHAMAIEPYPSNEHLPTAYWFIGKYDNEFIKIDEEWKLLKTHIIAFTRTPYNEGWVQQPDARRIYHPNANPPQGKGRIYTYHPNAVYTPDGNWTWGPHLPKDGTF